MSIVIAVMLGEYISTPINVKCDNKYWYKVWGQEFWYILPGLAVQPEQSINDLIILQAESLHQVVIFD